MTDTIHRPTRVWRTIRGANANWKTSFYTTKERRDAAAQRDANRDRDQVLCEEWTEDTARNADPINQGWALDHVARPTA